MPPKEQRGGKYSAPLDVFGSFDGIYPHDPENSPLFSTIVLCGLKFSSKSYMALSAIHRWLLLGRFDSYHICAAALGHEQNNSYGWLQELDGRAKGPSGKPVEISMYDSFSHPKFKERVDKDYEEHGKSACIFIDDATGSAGIFEDPWMIQTFTRCRHQRRTIIVALHGLRGVLRPIVRSSTDILCCCRMTNQDALKSLYRENLSMFFGDEKEFLRQYNEMQANFRFPMLVIDLRPCYGTPVFLNETNNPMTLQFAPPIGAPKPSEEDKAPDLAPVPPRPAAAAPLVKAEGPKQQIATLAAFTAAFRRRYMIAPILYDRAEV